MKILAAAAVAVLVSSGMAFAQDNTTTGATGGAAASQGDASDANANYLTGPNIQRFYTDESMTTLRPEPEMKAAWEAMNEQDRAAAKQACMGNKDNRWSTLCNSIGTM
jgi:hypothetical protein